MFKCIVRPNYLMIEPLFPLAGRGAAIQFVVRRHSAAKQAQTQESTLDQVLTSAEA